MTTLMIIAIAGCKVALWLLPCVIAVVQMNRGGASV